MAEKKDAVTHAKGLVAIFTDENGSIIATAAEFGLARPGGYKLIEAQQHFVKEALARNVMDAYASEKLWRAIENYDRTKIMNRLERQHGCKVRIIPIGYTDEEASIL